ncbi:neutral amino acid transporter 9 isoform X1 [Falco biarmicus]|uniref:neutral amino acid transporter 9 isoform X1 n=3 Tax=Falco biarmicus TaxID=345155 RepID=UPI0024BD3806|nr:neutral amino acid transporter 9 isoform X1 [Falco biarmicus]XP_056180660.1 neutral amino acid transporter 9 isoform X1 [Falco biarmicus]XP_056180661.1 neutral amino acid transporter 9 isoform X1 [Falco biarmicus]XP_056180662.1 neutral amino acid transporter 9 isoform X1 [Falco biarmicus]XP_056180663.1 neutral amino acid transporter 9 isoform X1 [Falco biarmicus]XP_056180664.1 neutral amino acid transporter 9 isoform X1 [Falco biarmicus]XP_056180665.1 neutral amino acid transporter 9 isofo
MEEDTKPLLVPVGGDESNYGIMNIQFNPEDFKCKRPFHVEPTNIVSVNDDMQRVTDEASAMNKRIHYYSRLTSPADRALIAPDHVLPAPDEIYVYSPLGTAFKVDSCTDGYGKNSSIVTIFMIWNTMMGTSILSIPWGIKQAGFTSGIILILLMGILTLYCCYRVVESRKMIPLVDTSNWEFPDVCKYYFGSFGQWSSLLFSMVSLVGAMVVYWVLMSNFLFNTGKFIYNFIHDINVTDIVPGTNGSNREQACSQCGREAIKYLGMPKFKTRCYENSKMVYISTRNFLVICPSATSGHTPQNRSVMFSSGNDTGFELFEEWWNKSQTVPFYLIALLLPLLNLKSPSFFAKFNVLGTISVIYLVFLVTVKAAYLGIHLEYNWFAENDFFVPEFRILFPQLTGVLTLAFFIHNCVITLLQNNKNQENNVRDLSIAYFLVGLTYLYVGMIIFASFPSPPLSKECIEQNFLDNFPSDDIMSFVARIFLLFQMMTVYPLLGYLARVQLLRQFFGNAYPSIFHVLILNVAIVGAGVAMARFYPNIGGIIRYSGATCGLAFVFVYPSLIYMISLHRAGRLTWPALIIHIFIILLGLANLIAQFLL